MEKAVGHEGEVVEVEFAVAVLVYVDAVMVVMVAESVVDAASVELIAESVVDAASVEVVAESVVDAASVEVVGVA